MAARPPAERRGWQERVHLAEVLQLKGWMLMRQGKLGEAETRLRVSIDCARQLTDLEPTR